MRIVSGRVPWGVRQPLWALLAWVGLAGCGGNGNTTDPVLIEMNGVEVRLSDVRRECDRVNGAGSFDRVGIEEKSAFLKTIGDKEILVRLAREETGGLKPPYDRLAREENEGRLLDAFDNTLLTPIDRDTVTSKGMLDKFNKQIRFHWIITRSDSTALLARKQLLEGRPFPDVARQFSEEDSSKAKGGQIPWLSAETIGRDFAYELYVQDREPGYISEMRASPRGFEVFRVDSIRPFDWHKIREGDRMFPALVRAIRAHHRMVAWTDSLKQADGLEIFDPPLPILRNGMKAYWDTLRVRGRQAPEIARNYEPPLSFFSGDELKMPLYKIKGHVVTLGDFIESLRTVSMSMWPGGLTPEVMRQQAERRIINGVKFDLARAMGLDKQEGFLADAKHAEEKQLLEMYEKEVLAPKITVTDEEAEAYYEENKETFRLYDKMRLSYAIFPDEKEAREFQKQAMTLPDTWWARTLGKYEKRRPDIHVVMNSVDYDLTQPIPDEAKAMVDAGRDMRAGDVLPLVRCDTGGWASGRLLFREKPGYTPFERAIRPIRKTIETNKLSEMVDEKVNAAREKWGLKLHPERIPSIPGR